MGAELGATTSLFPFDDAHGRLPAGHRARRHRRAGRAAPPAPGGRSGRAARPARSSTTRWSRSTSRHARAAHRRPALAGPGAADLASSPAEVKKEGWPAPVRQTPHRLLHQLLATRTCGGPPTSRCRRSRPGVKAKAPFLVTPGLGAHLPDDQARRHDGDLREDRRHRAGQRLRAVHRAVEAHRRGHGRDRTPSSRSFNRNFPGRNDGSAGDAVVHRPAPRS